MIKIFKLLILIYSGLYPVFEQFESEKYIVIANKLNVRDQPNLKSELLGQLDQGEKVIVVGKIDEWFIINIENDENQNTEKGYVHQDYLKLESQLNIDENSDTKPEIDYEKKIDRSFTEGFFYYGKRILFGSFLIIATIDQTSKRKKDNRRTKGYKEAKVTGLMFFKYIFYSVAVSIPCSLIAGLICYFA
jgi:uncharacterized protein YgiM (DUF1202 family)